MQAMQASEFQANCLETMDGIQVSSNRVTITRNSKSAGRLMPIRVGAQALSDLHEGEIERLDADKQR